MEKDEPTRCARVSSGYGAGCAQANTLVTLTLSRLCTITRPQKSQLGACS